jgi:hypothetical protein
VYHGEFKNDLFNGYGQIKYSNKDEYDGKWRTGRKVGRGIFKEASTGKVIRGYFRNNKLSQVFEVIEKGQ